MEPGAGRPSADRMATLVRPDANPRSMESVHEVQGFVALYQSKFRDAANHFAQGNLDRRAAEGCVVAARRR